MRLVGIGKTKPGDILGQSILGNDGCILLREGVALTERYIKKLIEIGVEFIYIKDGNLIDIRPEDPAFVDLKSEAAKSLTKIFSKIQFNNKVEINDTLLAISDIVEYLIENREINSDYLLELKTFDNYTYIHCLNTCILALFFGVTLGYSKQMLIDLGTGALLHDIGKTKIPLDILNKNGKLTDEEYSIMKKHPEYGYELIKNLNSFNERGKLIVLEHHERIDGRGYPYGLKGDRISKFARIVCISDVYDALVSDRSYRRGFSANEAYEFILAGSGSYFDPELVKLFRNNFSIYPLGVCVRLTNGLEAFVVGHNKGFPDRPTVRVLYDELGNIISPVDINLKTKLDVCIERVIV